MRFNWKYIGLFFMITALLPLILTRIISGKNSITLERETELEKFLPIILCQTIPWDYEEEMLKAQAVLERSSLYYLLENGEKDLWSSQMDEYYELSQKKNFQEIYQIMETAVKETKGQVIRYDDKIYRGIYHKVSAGKTRNGNEVFQTKDLSHLQVVESTMDLEYDGFMQSFYFTQDAWKQRIKDIYPDIVFEEPDLENDLKIVDRDSSGYVMVIQAGNLAIAGEEFREICDLSSSNFTIQFLDGSIRFLCNGVGHGFGLSQYGGNELAKNGYTYMEILEYYFPDAEIY